MAQQPQVRKQHLNSGCDLIRYEHDVLKVYRHVQALTFHNIVIDCYWVRAISNACHL